MNDRGAACPVDRLPPLSREMMDHDEQELMSFLADTLELALNRAWANRQFARQEYGPGSPIAARAETAYLQSLADYEREIPEILAGKSELPPPAAPSGFLPVTTPVALGTR